MLGQLILAHVSVRSVPFHPASSPQHSSSQGLPRPPQHHGSLSVYNRKSSVINLFLQLCMLLINSFALGSSHWRGVHYEQTQKSSSSSGPRQCFRHASGVSSHRTWGFFCPIHTSFPAFSHRYHRRWVKPWPVFNLPFTNSFFLVLFSPPCPGSAA